MNYLQYNKILDNVSLYEGLENNTLTIRLEGNICEYGPSYMHRYDISNMVKPGLYIIDFSSYVPKYRYELTIKNVNENSIDITFNGNDYTLHEGVNHLFDIREYQASYDGPWFTGVDELQAVWFK